METYNVHMSRHLFNMAAADAVEKKLWKVAALAGVILVGVSVVVGLAV